MNKYFWFSSYRLSLAIAGPITTAIIILTLSPYEMGIYYVFSQLLLFSLALELSCGVLITQSFGKLVNLSTYKNKRIKLSIIDYENFKRVELFSKKIATIITPLSFVVSWPIGFYVLNQGGHQQYQLLWFLFSILTSGGLLIQIYTSKLEGYNSVALAQKIRFISQIIRVLFLWISLVFGLKINALVISAFFALFSYFLIYKYFIKKIEHEVKQFISTDKVDIYSKIKHQSLITISNLFGNFVMRNLLVVIVFYVVGAEAAGAFGLSVVMLEHIFVASLIPLHANLAKISRDTSQRKNHWNIFKKALLSLLLFILGVFSIFIVFTYISNFENLSSKIIDPNLFLLLSLAYLPRFIIEPVQTYLRALDIEPFWIPNLIIGLGTLYYLFFHTTPFVINQFITDIIFLNIALLIMSFIFFIFLGFTKKFRP